MISKSIEHIYIHVPFCLRKCGYCSFYSESFTEEDKQKYLCYLKKEIELWQEQYQLNPRTIYFGGGTPSLLSAAELDQIIDRFELSQIEEITLEANPASISKEYVYELAQTKINRISLGIQSFLDAELKLLGRLHDSDQAQKAYGILRNNGFENISLDLMYGLPNQTETDLISSIEKIVELKPEHISTYCLSLEEDIPLFSFKDKIPLDDTVSDFYYLVREKLLEAGYIQYEISNFTKPGNESKHNMCYWNDKSYLGLGPAASGYLSSIRYTNPMDLEKYFQLIESKEILQKLEMLNSEDHEKEFIFLSLRKTEGMNLNEFKSKFKVDFLKKYQKIIDKFKQQDLLEIEDNFVRLTLEAYFVSNEIFSEFV